MINFYLITTLMLSAKSQLYPFFSPQKFGPYQRKIEADMYLMYIKPIIDCSVSIWAPHTNRAINQLNSIQHRGARFIMSYYRRASSVSNMLSYLQWSSIESQHEVAIARLIMLVMELLIFNYLLSSNTHQGP